MKVRLGLRWRILSTTAVTLALVLVVVWFGTRRTTEATFLDFLVRELPQVVDGPPDLQPYGELLRTHHEETGGWSGVERVLERIERELGEGYSLMFLPGPREDSFVIKEDGAIVSTEERFLLDVELQGREHNVAIADPPSEVKITDPEGRLLARLIVVPDLPTGGADMQRRFQGSLTAPLFLGLCAAGLVGLFLTAALARRILRPVEELTAAAERLGRGDRSARLEPRGRDELGALAATFNTMAASLEREEHLRRDLVSDVAHELRTPLTNVRCQLEAVQDGLLPPSADVLASLHGELAHLARVVDDLQELSLAEAGQLSLELEDLDPTAELTLCRARFAPRPLVLHLPEGRLPFVHADRQRMQQILANLVGNALQHGPEAGRIELRVEDQGKWILFAVHDEGEELDPRDLASLFERFQRRDRSRSRTTGGVGLGLAIVRQLVQAMGGEVGADQPLEGGQRFWFRLPAS